VPGKTTLLNCLAAAIPLPGTGGDWLLRRRPAHAWLGGNRPMQQSGGAVVTRGV
jgi:hypothetical protein